MKEYIVSVDQSTQGTKAMLFDAQGDLLCRADKAHRQMVDAIGWVEHDPEELYANTLQVIRDVVEQSGIEKNNIAVLGISNQRETSVAWNKKTGKPLYNAIVWQCARGEAICEQLRKRGCEETVFQKTGIHLSPYFPAAKLAWIFRNVEGSALLAEKGEVAVGTVDSWLIQNAAFQYQQPGVGYRAFRTVWHYAAVYAAGYGFRR